MIFEKIYTYGIFISLGLVVYFLSRFKNKNNIKKLVLISEFVTLGTVSRCFLYFVHYIKPLTSIVIISSFYLGAENGCLVGILSMLLSNIFLGQGPWTFYQMLSAGLVGKFSGLLFNNLKLDKKNLFLISILNIFFVYAPIMNFSSYFVMYKNFNLNILSIYLINSIINDIIHVISTIVILFLLTKYIKKVKFI
ncbi:MAG: ECF transporter S component [Candidatus Paraimprobicoccus trichonymphae]|uniref:ECF transporter S component n=1 Tax=Candidatus Paraimprobicoccus trichonymphae TaxID=3033793 RepID=A0AA48HX51_9FIRM|nr:MAG: ECF transporter S component [Candidatus Paraimprobicoccus trichonymphae]